MDSKTTYSLQPFRVTHWFLPLLALLLFGIGFAEYPRALEKMHRSFDEWHLAKVGLAMAVASIAAFWLGRHAEWIKRLTGIRPRYWFITAVALASIPVAMGWNVDDQPSWKGGISNLYVYPGHLSILAFMGWVASVREQSSTEQAIGWKTTTVYVALGLIWSWAVVYLANSPVSVMVALPVVVWMMRGTPLFRSSMLALVASTAILFFAIIANIFRQDRLLSVLAPFDDSLGRNFVSLQVRKSLEDAGWLGTELLHHLPNASHQFMLATVGEHWGWLGFLAIVGIVSTLFAIIHRRLRDHPDLWLRTYVLGILGTLVLGSGINWIANLGLTGPSGLGIPFLSQNWFLAGVAAFVVGVASRKAPSSTDISGPATDKAPVSNSSWGRSVATPVLVVLVMTYFGLSKSGEIAAREKPKPLHPMQTRAEIVDRNGVVLATNEKRLAVWLDMPEVSFTSGRKLAALGKLIDKSPEDIYRRARQFSNSPHLYIAYNLPLSIRSEIESLSFPGLHLEEMNTRVYPKGQVTSHVLGITTGDTDSRGLAGIELHEDRRIASRRGPSPIQALRLNLDIRIQEAAYAALHDAASKHGVNAGAVIVANKEGQILAMANAPAFDPANRTSIGAPNTKNQALDNTFHAGNLLHPLSRAAAISESTDIASHWWLTGKLKDLGFDSNPRPGFYKSSYIDGIPVGNWGYLPGNELTKPQIRTTLSHLVSAYLSLIDGGVSSNLSLIERDSVRWRNRIFDAETAAMTLGELTRIPLNDTRSRNSIGGAYLSTVDSAYDPIPRAIDAFIAFAPLESPRYVVAVMLQRNQARHITDSPSKSIARQLANVVIGLEKQASP